MSQILEWLYLSLHNWKHNVLLALYYIGRVLLYATPVMVAILLVRELEE